MRATAIYWSLVALIPIYIVAVIAAIAAARYLFRGKTGELKIWIPPAIYIAIKVGKPTTDDKGPDD